MFIIIYVLNVTEIHVMYPTNVVYPTDVQHVVYRVYCEILRTLLAYFIIEDASTIS